MESQVRPTIKEKSVVITFALFLLQLKLQCNCHGIFALRFRHNGPPILSISHYVFMPFVHTMTSRENGQLDLVF